VYDAFAGKATIPTSFRELPLVPVPAPKKPVPLRSVAPSPFFGADRETREREIRDTRDRPKLPYAPTSTFTQLPTIPASPLPTPKSEFPPPQTVVIPPPSARSNAAQAIVRRTFVPTMPDELPISSGEAINVVSSYDDGWALCSNAQGMEGVVPLECLEIVTTPVTSSYKQRRSTIPAAPSSWNSHSGYVNPATSPGPPPPVFNKFGSGVGRGSGIPSGDKKSSLQLGRAT